MEIYYKVVNLTKKQLIDCRPDESIKWPGLIHPNHPIPKMLMYLIKNEWYGDKIAIVNDGRLAGIYDESLDWENISKRVYLELADELGEKTCDEWDF